MSCWMLEKYGLFNRLERKADVMWERALIPLLPPLFVLGALPLTSGSTQNCVFRTSEAHSGSFEMDSGAGRFCLVSEHSINTCWFQNAQTSLRPMENGIMLFYMGVVFFFGGGVGRGGSAHWASVSDFWNNQWTIVYTGNTNMNEQGAIT